MSDWRVGGGSLVLASAVLDLAPTSASLSVLGFVSCPYDVDCVTDTLGCRITFLSWPPGRRCHVDPVCFWCDLQIIVLHVDRQVSGGVFLTGARNVIVCKFRSSIMVSDKCGRLVTVNSMCAVCMELLSTTAGTVGIGALGLNWDHHINSGEDVDRGHFDRPHVGDVANRRS